MIQHASRRLFWSLLCGASTEVHSPVYIPAARVYAEIELPAYMLEDLEAAKQLQLPV